jgi:hypothetical protein
MKIRSRITQVILTTASLIVFAVAAPLAFAQQDTQGKPTAKGQMKESGKEAGRAGKSLGHNIKAAAFCATANALSNTSATPAGT